MFVQIRDCWPDDKLHILEEASFQQHRCENLKYCSHIISYIYKLIFETALLILKSDFVTLTESGNKTQAEGLNADDDEK